MEHLLNQLWVFIFYITCVLDLEKKIESNVSQLERPYHRRRYSWKEWTMSLMILSVCVQFRTGYWLGPYFRQEMTSILKLVCAHGLETVPVPPNGVLLVWHN